MEKLNTVHPVLVGIIMDAALKAVDTLFIKVDFIQLYMYIVKSTHDIYCCTLREKSKIVLILKAWLNSSQTVLENCSEGYSTSTMILNMCQH
jgi:hypothetical protein